MIYFLVYNDNTHNSHVAKLLESVKKYGEDFKIVIFNKSEIDKEFVDKNSYILNCKRGGGYWLWKPYIVNETLKKINNGDIIFYMDSTYYFYEKFANLYEDNLKDNDMLLWKNKPNESLNHIKNYCKMDVIHKYGLTEKAFNENAEDCWAGAFVIKKRITLPNIFKNGLTCALLVKT